MACICRNGPYSIRLKMSWSVYSPIQSVSVGEPSVTEVDLARYHRGRQFTGRDRCTALLCHAGGAGIQGSVVGMI